MTNQISALCSAYCKNSSQVILVDSSL